MPTKQPPLTVTKATEELVKTFRATGKAIRQAGISIMPNQYHRGVTEGRRQMETARKLADSAAWRRGYNAALNDMKANIEDMRSD